MLFEVKGVKRATGEKVRVKVDAPDERAAGWSMIDRGIEVLSITPINTPPPLTTSPIARPARRPPHPGVQKIARVLLIASAVTLLVTIAYLIPSHVEYARVSDRAELRRRMPRMASDEIERRYPFSGHAGMLGEYRNLADAERHEADLRAALYRIWAAAGAAVVVLVVAAALQPFRRDDQRQAQPGIRP
jgi:hypothetical protein